jgi:hypothetical protein
MVTPAVALSTSTVMPTAAMMASAAVTSASMSASLPAVQWTVVKRLRFCLEELFQFLSRRLRIGIVPRLARPGIGFGQVLLSLHVPL